MGNLLGQHFLKNAAIIKKIIAAVDPQSGETIIEIGPGHGELTFSLAEACKKTGAKIIAVEKDGKLATALQEKIAVAEGDYPIQIFHGDILEFLENKNSAFTRVEASGLKKEFKIAGNIPYYLTGHLLRIVSELEIKPERAVLMIQKEVAERIVAEPPRMNRLAASVQFWAETKIIAQVPRADFTPPPEVDSAVIALHTKKTGVSDGSGVSFHNDIAATEKYYAAVRILFAQPRKTILNNLSAGDQSGNDTAAKKNGVIKMLEKLNINPKSRPQDLTIENIAAIARQRSSVHK